jgi:hypothetical protein
MSLKQGFVENLLFQEYSKLVGVLDGAGAGEEPREELEADCRGQVSVVTLIRNYWLRIPHSCSCKLVLATFLKALALRSRHSYVQPISGNKMKELEAT